MSEEKDQDELFQEKMEVFKEKWEPRIVALMKRWAAELEELGFCCDAPEEMTGCDEYQWWFMVYAEARGYYESPHNVDVKFIIVESMQHDGNHEGINFMLDAVDREGRIHGSLALYNFTDKVWVDLNDEDEIDNRFGLFEDVSGDEIASSLPDEVFARGLCFQRPFEEK